MARYVLSGSNPGLLKRGTIDIDARLKVHVPIGHGYGSVYSASWHLEPSDFPRFGLRINRPQGAEILGPQIIKKGGKYVVVSGDEAAAHVWGTGQHLGIFDTVPHANSYANRLHLEQARAGRGG